MSQSLSKVLLHVVFSTKQRRKLIPAEVAEELYAYIAGICRQLQSEAYRVGGTEDHVHIACTLPRTIAVSKLLEEVKKASSVWIKGRDVRCRDFAWQAGYGAFSLGQSQLGALIRYIENQREHHRTRSFKEELLVLFDKYGVAYDERYLWNG